MGAARKTGMDVSRKAATRIRIARLNLGMTREQLSKRLTDAGCPLSTTGVWKVESGYRANITVDEAVAFTKALRMSIERLLSADAACRVCDDEPPTGSVCLNCDAEGER
jgi:transcriptional regulator with XRE-family HTH domain